MLFFKTKSYIPQAPNNLVNRTKLVKKLDQGLDKNLTIVTAPIGFGKTSLVSEWVSNLKDKYNIAWLNIDSGDNNPIFFISYIINVLSKNNSYFGKSTELLLKSSINPDLLINSIINEIETKLEKTILIMDDFHLIENDLIKEYMSFFISKSPSKIHLVIISRIFPDLHIGKLRLQNKINEIDIDELRFSFSEEKDFLNKTLNLDLKDEAVNTISNKTEGWIAGLQFTTLALKERDLTEFIKNFTGNNIYIEEYLTDEVLSNLEHDIRNFLLKTSFLDRFNSDLCNHILGIDNSSEFIEKIRGKNLFIIPLDDNQNWFRYHNLFKNMLFKRLNVDNKTLENLKRLSLSWFEDNNFTFEALNYALDLKDLIKYAQLLNKISIQTIVKGEFSLFKTLAHNIPEKILSEYSMLCLCLGWINCLTHNLSEVEKYIEYAENSKDKFDLDSEINIDVHIELLRAYYFTLYSKADFNYFKRCTDILIEVKHEIKEDLLRGAVERILGGMYVVTYEWEKASQAFKNAKDIGKNSDNYIVWITSVGMYALLLILTGNNNKAFQICDDTLNHISKSFEPDSFPLLGYIYHPFGKVLYELGDYDNSCIFLEKAINYSEKIENKFLQITSILELALIEVYEGNNKKSLELLEKAEFILDNTPIYIDIFIEFNLLKLWIFHNKTERLKDFEQKYLKDKTVNNYRNECRDLIFSNILYMQGKFTEVENLLKESLDKNHNINSSILYIERMLFYSFILKKNSKFSKAFEVINLAITTAQKFNYFKTIINYYTLISDLLDEVEKNTSEEDLITYILKIKQATKVKERVKSLPENLSEREIEILKLICIGFTNQDISDKLIVALGTVKKHTNTIYAKLGVNNRVSAIQKAKDLGFI